MYFLFSGEGPTDLGVCAGPQDFAEEIEYLHGPLTVLADQLVTAKLEYSFLEIQAGYGFLSELGLERECQTLRATRKGILLPGRKREKETAYFFSNARGLARFANTLAAQKRDIVIAVLFRDSDGTASADRGEWSAKWKSVADGFLEEGFDHGVPMIPRPKSEAWLLCALQDHPYQNCEQWESWSGNDRSPHSLKVELERHLGENVNRELLCELVSSGRIDAHRIHMPSFIAFRTRFEQVIGGRP